jgi:hypothetical protein
LTEVNRVQTPCTRQQVAPLLVTCLREIGETPTQGQCALLLAQVMLETANGAQCNNWNVGNITSREWETSTFFRPEWYEVDETSSGKLQWLHQQMLAGKAPRAFAAYDSLEAGVRSYVVDLKHMFPSLLEASRTGSAPIFADAIRSSKYTPDAPPGTADSIASRQRQYLAEGLFAALPLARRKMPTLPDS